MSKRNDSVKIRRLAPLAAAPLMALASAGQANTFDCNTALTDVCAMTVSPEGGAGVEIRAPGTQFHANVDGTGFEISGTIELSQDGIYRSYTLYNAALVAEYATPGHPEQGFRRIRGTAEMRNQKGVGFGMLEMGKEEHFRVDVGLELGSILEEELNVVHLNPTRPCNGLESDQPGWQECPYWIFKKVDKESVGGTFGGTDIGLNLSAGSSSSNNVTVLMDPADFFMYVGFTKGDMDSVTLQIEPAGEEEGEEEAFMNNDRGIGFSQHGYIPFSPRTTYGIESDIESLGLNFEGHMVVDWADIPLGKGIFLDGSFVFKFPVNEFTNDIEFDAHYQAAGNGDIKMEIPLYKEVLKWEMALGDATAGQKITPEQQVVFVSGDINKDFPWAPDALPMSLDYRNNYQVAAVFVNNVDPDTAVPGLDLTQSFLQMEGEYLFDFSLGKQGSEFGREVRANGFLRADFDQGIEFWGKVGDGISATAIHPLLQADRDVTLRLALNPWDVNDTLVELVGRFSIGGKSYEQQGIARFTNEDAYVGFPAQFDLNGILEAYHQIQDATRDAEEEVNKLNKEIKKQRDIVKAERKKAQDDLDAAQAKVNAAQAEVNKINASIKTNYKNISYYKGRISSWYRWYKKQKWYKKSWAYGRYLAKKAYYNGLIAAQYTAIGAKKVTLAAANTALNVAKGVLQTAKAAIVITPVDLDPRVAPLVVSRDAALALLNGLQNTMPEIPEIPGTIHATIGFTVDNSGLTPEARADYCEDGQCIEIKGGRWEDGLACITLPSYNREVCTVVPLEP